MIHRIKVPILFISIAIVAYALLSIGSHIAAQEISTGYVSESALPAGMVVSLTSLDDRSVVPANQDNIDKLLGVIIRIDDSLINISNQESNVQVVSDGLTEVIVSDINGEPKTGDYITVGTVNGIGVVAGENNPKILGVARGDFNNAKVQTITTENGETREIRVARIPILIQIGGNPLIVKQESFLPNFVQEGANTLAGQPVSPGKVIIAVLIIVAGVVGAMVVLYGAVSSTILSIGRNPLSNESIYGGLIRVVAISIGIIVLSVGLGYVVVRA